MTPKRGVPAPIRACAALVLSFFIALALDTVFGGLREEAQRTFHVMPAHLFQAVSPLVLAAMMLVLAWYLFVHLEPRRLPAVIFLVAGMTVLAVYLWRFLPFPTAIRGSLIGQIRLFVLHLDTRSSLFHLASFWAVAGLAGLLGRSPAARPQ